MKICGLRRPEVARAAARAGADAVGFVFARSSRRVTVEEAALAASAAREEAAAAGRTVEAWGVVVNEPVDGLREIARGVPLDVIQLHGDETPDFARQLVDLRLVKAVRVRGAGALEEIERLWATGLFEAILLDAFVEALEALEAGEGGGGEGARGGTGKTFDWEIARRAAGRVPVVLAGGLTPDNVARAVRRVRPRMVDASSGVESSPGVKDPALVERFVREARSAFQRERPGTADERR